MLTVSIIIPAWNEAGTLPGTLAALRGVDYDRSKCEIIVVAGGDDGTYRLADQLAAGMNCFQRYEVLPQEARGTKNCPLQQGIRESSNELVVLLDADTIVSEQWLKKMVGPIEDGKCDVTVANSEPIRKNWVTDYYMINKTAALDQVTTHPGHSMALRAKTAKENLEFFFQKDVWMGDDYLFQKRAMEQGLRVLFVKDANIKTRYPYLVKTFLSVEYRWAMAFLCMNGFKPKRLAFSVVVVGALVGMIPFHKVLFVLALFFNIVYVMRKTRFFFIGARTYDTRPGRLSGFIVLSYLEHMISVVAHICFFLGCRRDSYYQGDRA